MHSISCRLQPYVLVVFACWRRLLVACILPKKSSRADYCAPVSRTNFKSSSLPVALSSMPSKEILAS